MLSYLLYTCLFLIFIHLFLNYNNGARQLQKIPGPKITFIFGNMFDIMIPPEKIYYTRETWSKKYNGIFRVCGFLLGAVCIYNPDDVETILSNSKFNEKSVVYKILEPWLREGLLLSKNSKWRQRRKILTNAFHFNILNQFWEILEENSQKLVQTLESSEGQQVDIVPILSEYTLQSLCETSMGTRISMKSKLERTYKRSIYALGELFIHRFLRVYLYPNFIYNLTPWSRAQNKHLLNLHQFTKHVINNRKLHLNQNKQEISKYLEDNNDIFMSNRKNKIAMLDLLLMAEREGQIDEAGIQEEVDTFMFEGHDTTASALTFCLMSLANDKQIQTRVFEELRDIFGYSERAATTQDLASMTYLECCIKESLRLYPPVHFISRQINDEVTLSNHKVPPGTYCHILIYDLHRNPSLYENPLKFDPDRFLPENCIGRHPYAYIPFSAGPRNCIGQRFAMMEMKSAVAAVLRKYELEPATRHSDLNFLPDLVLRTSEPVYVKFIKRKLND